LQLLVDQSGLNEGSDGRFLTSRGDSVDKCAALKGNLRPGLPFSAGTTPFRLAFGLGNKEIQVSNMFSDSEPNLSTVERGAYMLAGLGLAAAAAKPRPNPILNIVALIGGSYLAWRGYVGNCPVKAALTGSGGSDRLSHNG
jgi:hypothetical protein